MLPSQLDFTLVRSHLSSKAIMQRAIARILQDSYQYQLIHPNQPETIQKAIAFIDHITNLTKQLRYVLSSQFDFTLVRSHLSSKAIVQKAIAHILQDSYQYKLVHPHHPDTVRKAIAFIERITNPTNQLK